jgi:ribosomal-protein-serine acetyltransferase
MTGLPRKKIKTKRLVLEPADPRHQSGLWEAIDSSLPQLMPWLPWAETTSPEDLAGFLDRAVAQWNEGVNWVFVISEGHPVGTVGLNSHDPLTRSCSIGYWLDTRMAHQGFMTEAASAVVSFAFDQLGLHRIELRAGTENVPSVRVAEKLGFSKEGTLRESGRGAGDSYHDHYIFGLLASDPRPQFHLR